MRPYHAALRYDIHETVDLHRYENCHRPSQRIGYLTSGINRVGKSGNAPHVRNWYLERMQLGTFYGYQISSSRYTKAPGDTSTRSGCTPRIYGRPRFSPEKQITWCARVLARTRIRNSSLRMYHQYFESQMPSHGRQGPFSYTLRSADDCGSPARRI